MVAERSMRGRFQLSSVYVRLVSGEVLHTVYEYDPTVPNTRSDMGRGLWLTQELPAAQLSGVLSALAPCPPAVGHFMRLDTWHLLPAALLSPFHSLCRCEHTSIICFLFGQQRTLRYQAKRHIPTHNPLS